MSLGFRSRQDFVLHKLPIDSGHRVVLKTAFTPLRVSTSIADRNGDHHWHLMLSNQSIQSRKEQRVGPIRPDDERRDAAWHILLRDVHAHAPLVWGGVAC